MHTRMGNIKITGSELRLMTFTPPSHTANRILHKKDEQGKGRTGSSNQEPRYETRSSTVFVAGMH